MPEIDPDLEDADIPQMAVDALNAAHQRALASGQPVLVVEGNQLIRIDRTGRSVIKQLAPRQKVSELPTRARQ